ncbi:diguanylate cyclase/phosphodiesterase [Gracilibacillus boraciitolerans JCM 21714]|uniref:Diguanylate cyclase/phosphodiesterase n=1 Tax=Gracilibacillus boraciitolerans JCM 21714 TaxID=1298598 RepID=W4VPU8_9BACI|nr:diguanylate cyclase/phosphodiesterase [Gracilibacillus boraciitolerans JCM 21714]
MEHNATHDYLTGLPNRRLFKSKLTERLCHPSSDSLAVLMLDIDDFKSINDTFGHDIGDAVIVEFGKKVSQYLGDNDIVARLGGDEFIVLLYSISYAEKAEQFANNIKEVMKKPWGGLEIGNIDVTTSIGITITNSEDNKDAFQLMKQADIALYEAKNDGKNGFYIYQDDTV